MCQGKQLACRHNARLIDGTCWKIANETNKKKEKRNKRKHGLSFFKQPTLGYVSRLVAFRRYSHEFWIVAALPSLFTLWLWKKSHHKRGEKRFRCHCIHCTVLVCDFHLHKMWSWILTFCVVFEQSVILECNRPLINRVCVEFKYKSRLFFYSLIFFFKADNVVLQNCWFCSCYH